ncbi:NADH/ubiquinone/plastoquinone (complex I) [Falsiroseomonas bella]|uniref:NADH/ubiquinone/plastoquinone (Complex I) n=1 Tax=Falsiroseomonas bella TaxID=2184016 RepID=A0A317F8B1_9PROT|nr:complex I subunit 5 family protein [Falsiroseomonas bella]PWS35391.1 NADH/ubiquinone/plastoquinone (complex I) [Falsiroseomonas bella]
MSFLLVLAPLMPLAMCIALAWPSARAHVQKRLWAAPLPALIVALLVGHVPPLVADAGGLRLTLLLDLPGALLLGGAALLWSAAGLYARAYLGDQPRFAAWWLLTQSGSLGVFIAGDLGSFYLAFAVASLAGFGLVVQDGTAAAIRAGALYLLLAVLGEIALLFAFALLAVGAPGESIAIADVVPPLAASPGGAVTALLLVLGFGLKMGLVPLHVWLPVAHPAAPMPASAVLSGAIVKAGVIGLIRFLPEHGAPGGWGTALAVLGFLTAYWGVVAGLAQRNPKTVLAYSTVSQMGVIGAVLGMGIVLDIGASGLHAAFYALHHMLAKGALFLGVGVALATGPGARRWVLPLALLLALGFGGLPPTGGALAKAAVKDELGAGIAAWCAALSAFGSTLLMLHFVRRVMDAAAAEPEGRAPPGLLGPWLGLGTAALVLPWLLLPVVGADAGKIWSLAAVAPVLLGAALAWPWRRIADRVPVLPEGDLLVLARRGAAPREALGRAILRFETLFRPWPAAGLSLLAVVLGLLAAMAARPG